MRRRAKKLTPNLLRKIVVEETRKSQRRPNRRRAFRRRIREDAATVGSGALEPIEDVDADEVPADKLGTSVALEKDIDHAQALKLEEAKLSRRIRKIREARKRVRARIAKRL